MNLFNFLLEEKRIDADRVPITKKVKEEALVKKGGKCVICGYNKYSGALELHHIQGRMDLATELGFTDEKHEPDKTVLLCSNCHKEVSAGLHPGFLANQETGETAHIDQKDFNFSDDRFWYQTRNYSYEDFISKLENYFSKKKENVFVEDDYKTKQIIFALRKRIKNTNKQEYKNKLYKLIHFVKKDNKDFKEHTLFSKKQLSDIYGHQETAEEIIDFFKHFLKEFKKNIKLYISWIGIDEKSYNKEEINKKKNSFIEKVEENKRTLDISFKDTDFNKKYFLTNKKEIKVYEELKKEYEYLKKEYEEAKKHDNS